MWLIEELANPARKNPKLDEYFDQQTKSQALVREFIQNSLDAVNDDNKPVEVIFKIGSIEKSDFDKYFESEGLNLDKHLESCGIEYKPNKCRYLKIEDYNTKGLNGELNAKSFVNGEIAKGDFIGFWWSQGIQGDKITGSGGSHGVGKIKLSTSSQLNFFLAETIRSKDKKKLVLGYSTLRFHHIDERLFESEGRFGKKKYEIAWPYEWDDKTDRKKILQFEKDFGVNRGEESGLSVIIPFIDDEIDFGKIVQSVLEEYYFSIIREKLIVKVKSNSESVSIESSNIMQLSKKYLDQKGIELIQNSKEIATILSGKMFYLNDESPYGTDPKYQLSQNDFYDDEIEKILETYQKGQFVGFSLPIVVSKRVNGIVEDLPSRFFVFTKKNFSKESLTDEIYIRGNLLLNRENNGNNPKSFTMVYVSRDKFETLSEYLKYAEDPGHDKWNQNTLDRKLKEVDFEGRAPLQIIRSASNQIFNILNGIEEKKKIKGIYSDIFNIEDFSSRSGGNVVTPKPQPKPNTKKLPILSMKELKDGFKIYGNKNFAKGLNLDLFSLPLSVKIETGYLNVDDKGISAYDRLDFDLSNTDQFRVISQGINIAERDENSFLIEICDSNFNFECYGFDPNRDLDTRWELLLK
jgi:hypothetical protein